VTPRTWLLLSWIVVGAAVLVAHAVVFWQVVRARELEAKWRWLALFPPATPVLAWLDGRRVAPVVWAVFVVTYLALRLMEGRV
jgi:hypothetical protein